jgi:AcrR family transcriptional regulator
LNAAEHVFAEKGFHEATLSDIAKKAHVSEATIYEYFLSKEELLFSIPKEETLQYLEKKRRAPAIYSGRRQQVKDADLPAPETL